MDKSLYFIILFALFLNTFTLTSCFPSLPVIRNEPSKCGPNNNNAKCPNNSCCSKDGICGDDVSFCGIGCQPDFGHCFPISTDLTCGPNSVNNSICFFDTCCSQDGYCSSTYESCVTKCENGYGFCGSFEDGLEVIENCTVKNSIALTFDDGPRNITSSLLDKLKERNLKATFFVNGHMDAEGSCIYDNAEILQRAVKEGHQIAAHSWSHRNFAVLSEEEIHYQIDYLDTAFKKIIGTVPRYFRPPFGIGINTANIRKIMKEKNYIVSLWDVDSRDYLGISVADSEKFFSDGLVDGLPHISLSHDRIESTVNELADFEMTYSLEKSYKPMTLGECRLDSNWYQGTPEFGKRDDTWKCTKDDLH